MNTSIRRHLLIYLTVALLVSSVIISAMTYVVAGEELDELYDENFKHMAGVLLAQHSSDQVSLETSKNTSKSVHGEEEFLIQIWEKQGTHSYSSHPLIHLAQQPTAGFGLVEMEDDIWRYYSQSNDIVTVQISQPMHEREDAIIEMASKFLIPLLLQIPLLGLLIWWVVGKSLKPLNDVSQAIGTRSSSALQPIPSENLPQEIKPLVLALNNLLERLDEALKAQRRFTADAAHELRTPLTAVQLQLDLLKRSTSKKDKEEALKNLGSGIKRSIHVVKQLLSLAHQEPEAKEQSFEEVELVDVLHEAAIPFIEVAKQKNVTLHMAKPRKTASVNGHTSALRIMIENLLDNAIRYTPEGGKVEASITLKDEAVILSIADRFC